MEEIKKLLDTFDGELYNLCYELLEKYEKSQEIFEFVCKNYDASDEDNPIVEDDSLSIKEYFTEDEIEEYESIYGDIVDGLLYSNIKKCNLGLIEEKNFYKTLWESYCTNFSTIKERAFAFFYTIIDNSIPYVYLGKPLSMSDQRFKDLLDKNKANIEKIKFILKSSYSQRTERASLLLNCLNEIDDYESKVVVLSKAISLFNKERPVVTPTVVEDLLKRIDEKIKELEESE
ncbi:MAG: hypothetical protein II997_03755 [Clostridia bacterium]|nr:hypothetical protein [Clostridia bacterium]